MEQGFASGPLQHYIFKDSNATKHRCRSLVSLCLGVLGRHLEVVIEDLKKIAAPFPPDIRLALLGIAKRRGLLSDSVLLDLVDDSWKLFDISGSVTNPDADPWKLLDISGSDVTNAGLQKVAEICPKLKAVDISRCDQLTAESICVLLQKCHSLETLRCGGTPRSDSNARRCLGFLKPKLSEVEVESWEELASKDIIFTVTGARALRWLIWPSIDKDSRVCLDLEYPRITVNPSLYSGVSVPREALPGIDLDAQIVEDIDPKTWTYNAAPMALELCMGLFLSVLLSWREVKEVRGIALELKRAKNIRQHKRRAMRIHKIS